MIHHWQQQKFYSFKVLQQENTLICLNLSTVVFIISMHITTLILYILQVWINV